MIAMVRILFDRVQAYVALASCCDKVDLALIRDTDATARLLCLSCMQELTIIQVEPDPGVAA